MYFWFSDFVAIVVVVWGDNHLSLTKTTLTELPYMVWTSQNYMSEGGTAFSSSPTTNSNMI